MRPLAKWQCSRHMPAIAFLWGQRREPRGGCGFKRGARPPASAYSDQSNQQNSNHQSVQQLPAWRAGRECAEGALGQDRIQGLEAAAAKAVPTRVPGCGIQRQV